MFYFLGRTRGAWDSKRHMFYFKKLHGPKIRSLHNLLKSIHIYRTELGSFSVSLIWWFSSRVARQVVPWHVYPISWRKFLLLMNKILKENRKVSYFRDNAPYANVKLSRIKLQILLVNANTEAQPMVKEF